MHQAEQAAALRALHRPGDPLVLANVWDVATARLVEEAGAAAVATSSVAVDAALGHPDHDVAPADLVFDALARIAAGVQVPVTADVEAGYRLAPGDLAARLIDAGVAGCNLEDSDHHGDGVLVDPDDQAERIAALKEAARAAGGDLVVNARIDVYLRAAGPDGGHDGGQDEGRLEDALRRARRYREAGADCVYPIALADPHHIRALVDAVEVVNVLLRPGMAPLAELRSLGIARASVGGGLWHHAMGAARRAATALLAGDSQPFTTQP